MPDQLQSERIGERRAQEVQLRARNDEAVGLARDGVLPDPQLLRTAQELGSRALIAECQLCVVAALACLGRPREARTILDEVRRIVDSGVDLDETWRWRLENCSGLVAQAFGELRQTWSHHYSSLELALDGGHGYLAAWSRLNLARVSFQVGLVDEAESLLAALFESPDVPTGVRMNAHMIMAHLDAWDGDMTGSDNQRQRAELLWDDVPERRYRRLLVETAIWTFDSLPERWAEEYARRGGSYLSDLDSNAQGYENVGGLESELLGARVDFLAGDHEDAIAAVRSVIARSEDGLAITCAATFTLAVFLVEANQFERALEVLDDLSLNPAPPLLELRVVQERRRAFEALELWKQAASCFDDMVVLSHSQSQDVLKVIEMQRRLHESALIERQNAELRSKNAELELVSRDKEAIMNMIANHLQSPLTALKLTLRLLTDDPTGANVEHRVESALRTIRRMETLAEQLSLAGEIESGTVRPNYVPVPLDGVVDQVVRSAARLALARDVTIIGNVGERVSDVQTDPERLRQILDALVWGVAEFSPSGSAITVSAESRSGDVTAIRVDGPDLELSLESLDRMGRKWGPSSPDSMTNDMCSDLSFYTAEQLGEILGAPVCIESLEPRGFAFVLELPTAESCKSQRPVLT